MVNKKHNTGRKTPTLFRNERDLEYTLKIVSKELKKAQDGETSILSPDENNFSLIEDVVRYVHEEVDNLQYINNAHIIELFFKDPNRRILIKGGDMIKYKKVVYVQPPKYLYAGTVEGLKEKMMLTGIRSKTKGYIKLYKSEQDALSFASKFAKHPSDILTTILIDAESAFNDGYKFSTYRDGEYIVVQVDPKYIIKEGSAYEEQ